MTAAIGAVAADELCAGERQIANGVERLVTNELFLLVAQAFHIDDRMVVGDDNRIFQRGAKRVTGRPQALNITHEAKGASTRKLVLERLSRQVALPGLATDQRRIEIDFDFEARTIIRAELRPGCASIDTNRLDDADVAALHAKIDDANRFDGFDERCGASIHDRHFRTVDFNDQVVDTHGVDAGHDMFNGCNGLCGRTADHGAKIGVADIGRNRLHFHHGTVLQRAAEDDARSGFRRLKRHGSRVARMHADTLELNRVGDSCLKTEQSDGHAYQAFSCDPARNAGLVRSQKRGNEVLTETLFPIPMFLHTHTAASSQITVDFALLQTQAFERIERSALAPRR